VKMLGLLVVAAAALMAFAGSASATITSPAGTAYTGEIHMNGSEIWFHTGGNVNCKKSTLSGSVTNGGTTVPINELTFSECGTTTFAVLKKGHMSIASDGTVYLSGTEYTKLIHSPIAGTIHCILRMEETAIGLLTEGVNPATLHTDTYPVPSVSTDFGCGSSAELTGLYTVTEPTGAITID
jgi:hypothetical protein